ncbi:glycosyltransferase family 87 protein [Corynebacterium sp. L4756]|uniref:glycosyltransferase family 87 protein n=1 Tax=Corynebacterium sp. L4756 TaxID=3373097 RepID=UPI00374DF856
MSSAFHTRFDKTFSAHSPLTLATSTSDRSPADPDLNAENPASARTSNTRKIFTFAAWPLAIVLVLHRTFFTAFNGTATDDFTTVYSALTRALSGNAVYDQAYNHVDPLYLYNPGATLLLLPIGAVDKFEAARYAFIIFNCAAIVAALAILTRLMGHSLRGPVLPVSIALAYSTEAVINTLTFSNINGILLLLLAVFLACFISSFRTDIPPSRAKLLTYIAGLAIGLAIVIKPQFAPLLFLPLTRLDWRTTGTGIVVPVVLNIAAWPLIPGAGDYLTKLVPYLGETRDYANSSLAGWQAYFDIPGALYYPLWLITAASAAVGIIVLLRWRVTDIKLWALTTSGLLMVGVFTLSSLGQQYYSMWLFPMLFTVLLSRSVFHTWPAWLAAVLFLIPNSWSSDLWPDFGRWMSTYIGTIGWVLLIAVTTATACGWWRLQAKNTA